MLEPDQAGGEDGGGMNLDEFVQQAREDFRRDLGERGVRPRWVEIEEIQQRVMLFARLNPEEWARILLPAITEHLKKTWEEL